MRGVAQVQDDDTVATVRRALARQRRVASVRRDLHVVHGARIDLDRIRLHDARWVRHVPHERDAVTHLRAGERVVAAVLPLEHPEVGREHARFPPLPHDLDFAHDVALADAERALRHDRTGRREHRVHARHRRHEAPVLELAGRLRRRYRIVG